VAQALELLLCLSCLGFSSLCSSGCCCLCSSLLLLLLLLARRA
jgi:hypothetical protein